MTRHLSQLSQATLHVVTTVKGLLPRPARPCARRGKHAWYAASHGAAAGPDESWPPSPRSGNSGGHENGDPGHAESSAAVAPSAVSAKSSR
ncbi:hypothetical protein ACFQ51_48370 [Streptomyces kaempferi]